MIDTKFGVQDHCSCRKLNVAAFFETPRSFVLNINVWYCSGHFERHVGVTGLLKCLLDTVGIFGAAFASVLEIDAAVVVSLLRVDGRTQVDFRDEEGTGS